ncbi:C4-dicarboxylate TRAP transporter substrate-binding protein [Falsochrobactrum shanghaiense]|nr:C4-dicarboxylate TRAP transporter substrate-binding protein [Falsochrobactrum shanghaiense]
MKLKYIKSGLVGSALLLAASPALAEFVAATYNPPDSPTGIFMQDFADSVKAATDGEIVFNVFAGGSLLPADGSLSGISANVAQIGQVTANYVPSDLPLTFMLSDVSFTADDQLALGMAYVQTKLLHPKLVAEADRNNTVYATGYVIGIYNYICRGNVAKLEDLKGKKIRTATGGQVSFSSSIGAVPVQVPSTEIYTGLQRGSLDCTAGSPEFMTTFFKLTEVANSVYKLPLGGNANDGYYMNKDFWKGLTEEQRDEIISILPAATARNAINLLNDVEGAWAATAEAGIPVNEPEPEALARLSEYKANFAAKLAATTMERRGVEDPSDVIAYFIEAQDKWKGLLAGIDPKDEVALTALIKSEIFDKLDPATYGMN